MSCSMIVYPINYINVITIIGDILNFLVHSLFLVFLFAKGWNWVFNNKEEIFV